jgi:pimeloyl-ACP methyl ester carboxylesterase
MAKWPTPVRAVDVPSPFGTTRAHACGPADGRPTVLLHGGGSSSSCWYANVAALSRENRVYAVDRIRDAGRSVHDGRPIRRPHDLAEWLDAVADGLGLQDFALCGHSYGGWQALDYTLRRPQRVSRLALLDPTDCSGPVVNRVKARPRVSNGESEREESRARPKAAGPRIGAAERIECSSRAGDLRVNAHHATRVEPILSPR